MGERANLIVKAKCGDFAITDKPDEIVSSPAMYVHWFGYLEDMMSIIERALEILQELQKDEYSPWRQKHFVSDPKRILSLMVRAAWDLNADPQITNLDNMLWADHGTYELYISPTEWVLTGGDLGDERKLVAVFENRNGESLITPKTKTAFKI